MWRVGLLLICLMSTVTQVDIVNSAVNKFSYLDCDRNNSTNALWRHTSWPTVSETRSNNIMPIKLLETKGKVLETFKNYI